MSLASARFCVGAFSPGNVFRPSELPVQRASLRDRGKYHVKYMYGLHSKGKETCIIQRLVMWPAHCYEGKLAYLEITYVACLLILSFTTVNFPVTLPDWKVSSVFGIQVWKGISDIFVAKQNLLKLTSDVRGAVNVSRFLMNTTHALVLFQLWF